MDDYDNKLTVLVYYREREANGGIKVRVADEKGRIVIVNTGNIFRLPPVISLVTCLLRKNYHIHLIAEKVSELPKELLDNENLTYHNIKGISGNDLITRLKRRFVLGKQYRDVCFNEIKKDDILWTTTSVAVRILGKRVLEYKHIMQIMELEEKTPLFKGAKYLTFPIEKYAKKAYRVVVPEIHRAYMQKIWWGLDETPCILPNKPYSIECNYLSREALEAIEIIKNEKRKVILYLGLITANSNFESVVKAIKAMSKEYALYIIGGVGQYGDVEKNKKTFNDLIDDSSNENKAVNYLGYYPSPMHLEFLKYAYIGLISYSLNHSLSHTQQINILFCAPNKVFEYAGFGVPMIGDNILGLEETFDNYEIGKCCNLGSIDEVTQAINVIDQKHDIMSKKCIEYYNSVDYDRLLSEILS